MIKAIIFDFDGVLVESVDIKTKAFAGLFEHEGDSIVRRVVAYHIKNAGVSRFEKFRHIYKEMLDRELTEETKNSRSWWLMRLLMRLMSRAQRNF